MPKTIIGSKNILNPNLPIIFRDIKVKYLSPQFHCMFNVFRFDKNSDSYTYSLRPFFCIGRRKILQSSGIC